VSFITLVSGAAAAGLPLAAYPQRRSAWSYFSTKLTRSTRVQYLVA
jgi:hypothetical protein